MPGTSIRPYDAFYAASQRAKGPFTGAAKATGRAASDVPWYDPLVPVAHGLLPVGAGAALSAGLAGAVSNDKDRKDNMQSAALRGAALWSPAGVLSGLAAHEGRAFVRKGLAQGATFGVDPLRDFATKAHPHARASDPDLADAMKRWTTRERPTRADPFMDDMLRQSRRASGNFDEEKVQNAFRKGLSTQPTPAAGEERLLEELRKEFPGLNDRQLGGKLHPDVRGATEAPAEELDAAYRAAIGKGRSSGAAPSAGAQDTVDGIAQGVHAEGQTKARDFLRSWRGAPSGDLSQSRKFG